MTEEPEFDWDYDAPLDRVRGETRKAHTALRDYWLMGPGRGLERLWEEYRAQSETESGPYPPSVRLATIKGWSSRYHWQDRIDRAKQIVDDEIAELEREARREAVLNSGLALRYERIAALAELAELLQGELYDKDKRWLPDVKQIGAGDMAERVDIVRFNGSLVREFREALDDIAAELGHRVRGVEIQGGIGITSVSPEELAKARDRARALEQEILGDDE